jgi:hypothetical protein
MSGQRVEVEIEAIAGEDRQAARSQVPSQGVDNGMSHGLRARIELEHGQNLRARINDQTQPEHVSGATQSGSNFVQLQVQPLVDIVGELSSARQPRQVWRQPSVWQNEKQVLKQVWLL